MAQRKKSKICIIGGGLTGLTTAALCEAAHLDYVLIESQSELGGLLKGQLEESFWLDYGLKTIPVGPDISSNPLLKLRTDLELNVAVETLTEPPKVFSPSGFGAFMGFGEAKNRFLVEELGYYTETPRLMVSGGWHQLTEELIKKIPADRILKNSFVTKIITQEDTVTSVILNGEHAFMAESFVFTLSPACLKDLIEPGVVSAKTFQRIARTTPLTAVSLDIATDKKITADKNLFVFQENSKEKGHDPFFMIGQFVSNADPLRQHPTLQFSTWMTFVDPESLEDDENASKTIKTMKKLIKKAFPSLVEGKPWERLLVVPDALGKFESMTLEKDQTLPGLNNLWVSGG